MKPKEILFSEGLIDLRWTPTPTCRDYMSY